MYDTTQKSVSQHFAKDHWLNSQENAERFMDYVTYYRRNMCQFIQEYLGINLYWYQIILIYLMNVHPTIAIVASRAAAKSWIVALYACAKAILYPNTKVVIMSATKNMSSLIVEEKIKKELQPRSRRLALEIVDILTSQNRTEVKFRNDSSIVVVPALESGLGNRSSLLILEEFRRIPKDIVDRIAIPFQIVRPAEFRTLPEYSSMQELDEEPTTVYISSSGASWPRAITTQASTCALARMAARSGSRPATTRFWMPMAALSKSSNLPPISPAACRPRRRCARPCRA